MPATTGVDDPALEGVSRKEGAHITQEHRPEEDRPQKHQHRPKAICARSSSRGVMCTTNTPPCALAAARASGVPARRTGP